MVMTVPILACDASAAQTYWANGCLAGKGLDQNYGYQAVAATQRWDACGGSRPLTPSSVGEQESICWNSIECVVSPQLEDMSRHPPSP